jgi:hypothetical protein
MMTPFADSIQPYLQAHDLRIRKTHRLSELYEECRAHKLVIGSADRFQIGNIVALLESGNKFQGFRYFNPESRSMPDFGVDPRGGRRANEGRRTPRRGICENETEAATFKFDFTLGKPVPKDTEPPG